MALGLFTGTGSDLSAQYPASPEFPRPLDIFGGVAPAFAYGLRLLDSDYTGYAIRVRRDADDTEVEVQFDGAGNVSLLSPIVDGGTEQTGSVSGGTYTVETSELMTLGAYAGSDTCRVVKWYDQSGNTRDAFMTVEANQPILVASGVLEADGIDFVPNDYLIANYLLTTTNDHTFHAVAKTDDAGTYGILGDIDASYDDGAELITLASGAWSYRIDGTDLEPAATTTNKAYILASYETALGSNEQQLRVNGVLAQQNCTETLSFSVANRIRVGARRDTDNELNGKIAEIIAWNSKLTTAQQDILEANTLAHFNLSSPYSAYSLEFDGADEYVSTGADDVLATQTYSFWAKCSDTSSISRETVFQHGESYKGAFFFHWYLSKPIFFLGGARYRYWVDNAAQDDGNWHHWVLYADHTSMANCKLYVDGVLQTVDSTSDTGTISEWSPISIGKGVSAGQYFNGSLDEFAIFDGELSAAQILAIYNGGNPADLTALSPLHWWKMGEGNAISATITDHAETGAVNGTLVNGPIFTLDSPSY